MHGNSTVGGSEGFGAIEKGVSVAAQEEPARDRLGEFGSTGFAEGGGAHHHAIGAGNQRSKGVGVTLAILDGADGFDVDHSAVPRATHAGVAKLV